MRRVLVGTENGLFEVDGAGVHEDFTLEGQEVTALAAADGLPWIVADGRLVMRRGRGGGWGMVARVPDRQVTTLLPLPDGLLLGTEEAHLVRLKSGGLEQVPGFDQVDGRREWHTPWGGPPAVRSMTRDGAGRVYANVHVGGIPRSTDGGSTWIPTIDIEADVHQAVAHPDHPDVILAATAWGLAVSGDAGDTWDGGDEGLHATYLRALAVSDGIGIVAACEGPEGGKSAIYRVDLAEESLRFERTTSGLPEWFEGNIETGCLVAEGPTVAFATPDGRVFGSRDGGESWTELASGLPGPRALLLDRSA